jgi:hypothetical protein
MQAPERVDKAQNRTVALDPLENTIEPKATFCELPVERSERVEAV